jgi:NAD(P)-dependent dehydrogenase (short-subunit alcohol dehydrogenase family)
MSNLTNKVALVTGGSRGIGAGIAKRLAADGASVAITYTKGADAAASVVKEIKAAVERRSPFRRTPPMPMLALNRYGKVEEVAALVAFAAGSESSYITGANLTVDGGTNA